VIRIVIFFCSHSLLHMSTKTDKSIQSAGAAGTWRADARNTPYVVILLNKHRFSKFVPDI